jgi:hypothetical protein
MISEEEEGEAKMPAAADMYDDEHMRSFFLFFFLYGKDFGQTPMSCFFLCNGKGKGTLDKTDEEFFFFCFFFFFILQWTRGFWKQ